jgi:hypothetical protein
VGSSFWKLGFLDTLRQLFYCQECGIPTFNCIVTGGGLRRDGQRWVQAKRGYLLDVVELSAAYRDQLLAGIERLGKQGRLSGSAGDLAVPGLLADLRQKKWEVFIKPFAGPETVTDRSA